MAKKFEFSTGDLLIHLKETYSEFQEFIEEIEEEIRDEEGMDEDEEVPEELYLQWVAENIGSEDDYLERFKKWVKENYDTEIFEEMMSDANSYFKTLVETQKM